MADSWEKFFLIGEIEFLRAYLDEMESFLEIAQKRVGEKFKELESRRQSLLGRSASERSNAEWEQLQNGYCCAEAEDIFWNEVARRVRYSLFVALYTFYEKKLREICLAKQSDYTNLSVDDIAGRSITEKVVVYWEKVLGLRFPKNSYWGDIHQGYRRLRNCIVHNEGVVDDNLSLDDKRYIERFIRRREYKGLLSLAGSVIFLHEGFCYKVLDTFEEFFHALLDSVETA